MRTYAELPGLMTLMTGDEKHGPSATSTAATNTHTKATSAGNGDAAASLLGPDLYREFAWPYEKQLVDGIHSFGTKVRLHICGNTRRLLEGMGKLRCEIVDLDSLSPMNEARLKMAEIPEGAEQLAMLQAVVDAGDNDGDAGAGGNHFLECVAVLLGFDRM